MVFYSRLLIIKIITNLIVISCGDPTTNLSASKYQSATGSGPLSSTYNSALSVRCLSGYRLSDLSETTVITCQSTGIWNALINCIRTRFIVYYAQMIPYQIFQV